MEEQKEKVPELVINDNKVTLRTAEIPIVINGKETILIMQQVSAGKRRELSKKYMSTKIIGQEITGNVDPMGFEIGILSHAIVESPFEPSEEVLSKFPDNVIDYLYSKYNSSFAEDNSKKKD